jgi:molybdopterin-guanine dinucleotide biosynthesis protein A
MSQTDAILAAGGDSKPDDPLGPLTQGKPKAMLPIGGKPMAQWVLDALAASPNVGRVVAIGLTPELGLTCGNKPLDYIPSSGGILDNAKSGLRRVLALNPQAKRALWVSADIPAITAAHVNWLLDICAGSELDFYYTIIKREVMEARYPASRRTYTPLKEALVCGGDMNILATHLAAEDNPLWRKISETRKNVFKQAALVGIDTLLKLAFRQLSIRDAEDVAHRRLGVRGKAVLCPYAEIGMDVDKPFQYDIIVKDLAGKNSV